MNPSSKDVAIFYDRFNTVDLQKIGVNIRHRTILKNLIKSGLKNNANVLEIGCGIGTVTQLISKYLSHGKIVAVDISPESIETAKQLNKSLNNIEFLVSDMSNFHHRTKFDFVVLPDVLEHIPVENHKTLFKTIREHIHIDSTIFINIPNPPYLRWVHKNRPELLQIIDQPLSTQELLNNVYPNDLYLHSLNVYSLAFEEGDYQLIILKPNKELGKVTKISKSKLRAMEIKSRLSF